MRSAASRARHTLYKMRVPSLVQMASPLPAAAMLTIRRPGSLAHAPLRGTSCHLSAISRESRDARTRGGRAGSRSSRGAPSAGSESDAAHATQCPARAMGVSVPSAHACRYARRMSSREASHLWNRTALW